MEANFHDGVELRFTAALDDSKRQIQQIDSLVDSGIDLLIVAPNQLQSVTPAIDRAYDMGIRQVRRNIRPSFLPTTMRWGGRWGSTLLRGSMERGV